MKITKYNLVKDNKEFHYAPCEVTDGMVMESDCLDPETIATYDNLDEALAALKTKECYFKSYGSGFRSYIDCTEYWVETIITDSEDEDDIEVGDQYPGSYNMVKLYDEDEMVSIDDSEGFLKIVEPDMVDSWIEDENWLAEKLTTGDHTIVVKGTDGEIKRKIKVNIPEI